MKSLIKQKYEKLLGMQSYILLLQMIIIIVVATYPKSIYVCFGIVIILFITIKIAEKKYYKKE